MDKASTWSEFFVGWLCVSFFFLCNTVQLYCQVFILLHFIPVLAFRYPFHQIRGCLTLVKMQQPQEHRYNTHFHQRVKCICVQTMVWLTVFAGFLTWFGGIFNVSTKSWWCTGDVRIPSKKSALKVLSESRYWEYWEKTPLWYRGILSGSSIVLGFSV